MFDSIGYTVITHHASSFLPAHCSWCLTRAGWTEGESSEFCQDELSQSSYGLTSLWGRKGLIPQNVKGGERRCFCFESKESCYSRASPTISRPGETNLNDQPTSAAQHYDPKRIWKGNYLCGNEIIKWTLGLAPKNSSLLPNFLLLPHIKGCPHFDTTILLDTDKVTELTARGKVLPLGYHTPTLSCPKKTGTCIWALISLINLSQT